MGTHREVNPVSAYHLVLFDGVCNLCNGFVQFIINRDKKGIFRFASLQSSVGEKYLQEFNLTNQGLYSIILIKNGKAYDQSSAVLHIAKDLPGLWPALYAFRILPKFLTNGIYKLVAANRYRLFGRKDECMIPTPELKARFLQ